MTAKMRVIPDLIGEDEWEVPTGEYECGCCQMELDLGGINYAEKQLYLPL